MNKPSAKPPSPQPQPPRQACAGVGVATVAIAKVPASTNAVRARFMMFPPGQYLPMCLYVQTSHVEVTLETLTVDRKFLISASSNKQNQIVPSPKDTARPSESLLSPCHSSECVSKRD